MPRLNVDLHFHSTWSEGLKRPAELAVALKQNGVTLAALTDHNTIAGVRDMTREGQRRGIRIIPGVEIYARFRGRVFHVLGYHFDLDSPQLNLFLDRLHRQRMTAVKQCLVKLRAIGLRITDESVLNLPTRYIGLGTIIGVLSRSPQNRARFRRDTGLKHPKLFDIIHAYFAPGLPAALPETSAPIKAAIVAIKRAGGIPVLAHPGGQISDQLDDWISRLKRLGIRGIEVLTPYHTWWQVEAFQDLALKYKLFMTMGSDYHGDLVSPYSRSVAIRRTMDYYETPAGMIPQLRKGLHL